MKRFACIILLVIAFGRLSAQSNRPKAVLNHLAIYVVNLEKTMNFTAIFSSLIPFPNPFMMANMPGIPYRRVWRCM
jgi:hypothetical protein